MATRLVSQVKLSLIGTMIALGGCALDSEAGGDIGAHSEAVIDPAAELEAVRAELDARLRQLSALELEMQQCIFQNRCQCPVSRASVHPSIAAHSPTGCDQDLIRNALYSVRAQIGELRVEEQHWNQEVHSGRHVSRRPLSDLARP